MTISFTHDSPRLAAAYDRLSDSQFEAGKRLVERLAIAPGARVLDVGCGTGRLARWIASIVGPAGNVVGIDPLPERITLARANAAGITFEVGQAEDLGAFADESFDAVVMSAVFHWVTDQPKALAEVRRVLKTGGRVGITTLPRELRGAGTVATVLMPILQRATYAERVNFQALPFATHGVTTTDLVTMVLTNGLELSELHIVQRTWARAGGEELVNFLDASSFGNFARIVPEELRASLRSDLVAGFEERKGAEGIVVRDWGMVVVARRV